MRETPELWTYERQAAAEGFAAVCGVDEAGAGPLMGPVYAAAVILPEDCDLPELNDSKKLTEKKREKLFPLIQEQAVAWSVARVEASEIDETDILSARMKAMQMAIDGLSVTPDLALIDGNRDKGHSAAITTAHRCIVGGDGISASIAAASVLAKVSRDRYVTEVLDKAYPQYQFARHKGYGTKLHYEMLDKYGPCPEHRRSFLKKWEAKRCAGRGLRRKKADGPRVHGARRWRRTTCAGGAIGWRPTAITAGSGRSTLSPGTGTPCASWRSRPAPTRTWACPGSM